MRTVISTITSKGQITLPAAVRQYLRVGDHDQIAFIIEADQIRVQPVDFTLESAYGSVEPNTRPEDFIALARRAKEERAARTRAQLDKA